MREIKYKAYWHESKLMTNVDTIEFLEGGTRVSDGCMHTGWVGKDCELVQSTGVKDRTGNVIYESDIVEYFKTEPTIVTYNRYYGAWVFVGEITGATDTVYYAGGEYEVIGNIYENPELLKEG